MIVADGYSRLYIVLDDEGLEALQKNGVLFGSKAHITDPSWTEQYAWMAKRMEERLPPPPAGVEPWPLWAWRRKGAAIVPDPLDDDYSECELWLVCFDVDGRDVLLSDFDGWHHPLNGWFLPELGSPDEGLAEGSAFDAEVEAAGLDWHDRPYPEPFQSKMEDSWVRVFDVTDKTEYVQATFWGFSLSQVVSVEPCGKRAAPFTKIARSTPR